MRGAGKGGAAGGRGKPEKRWRGGGTRGGDAGSREMAGRGCGGRGKTGEMAARRGGAVATGQSGAGWTARNETRGCGEGAGGHTGIYKRHGCMPFGYECPPGGGNFMVRLPRPPHGNPRRGRGGVRLGALRSLRRARAASAPARLRSRTRATAASAPAVPARPRPGCAARKTPAGDGGRLGALCLLCPPRPQSYWQNATSFFVWYTVSTNCRSSGESV